MGGKNNLFEMGANFDEGWSEVIEVASTKKNVVKTQSEHRLVVQFEKRKGKPVTLVGRFSYDAKALKTLHKKIKQQLACGGTIEEEWLVFQGDHRDTIKALFNKQQWKFKT